MSTECLVEQVKIDNEITIYTVLALKNDLILHLQAGKNLQLNLSTVAEVDSAGIQLLIYLQKKAHELGLTLSLFAINQAVYDVIELFDLIDFFDDIEKDSETGDAL